MKPQTLAYRLLRPAYLLLAVFGFFLMGSSNFSGAATYPDLKENATIVAAFHNVPAATIYGDNSDEDVHAHTTRANRRGQNVRRVGEREFTKVSSVGDMTVTNPVPPVVLFRSLTFGAEDYLLRPFYYIHLFRFALF